RITEQLVLFEVESTHRLGLASAEEDGRHFARATRALAFFNGLLDVVAKDDVHVTYAGSPLIIDGGQWHFACTL
ncbi:hypothetical protein I5K84_16935, partial [Pseudomonas aeruginosa]|nr:hypothetical protein [Pseudomonas aeruginosa]